MVITKVWNRLTTRSVKIAAIICLLSTSLSIAIFSDRISEFAPKHIMVFFEISNSGTIPNHSITEFTPGYYNFGAILVQVTGFSEYQALFGPILLIPVSLLLFTIFYRLSDNAILSALLLAGYLLFGADGTNRLSLGLHGTGWVILFTCILALLAFLDDDSRTTPYYALILVASVSVAYISYNRSAEILLLLSSLALILGILTRTRKMDWEISSPTHAPKLFIGVIVISIAIQTHFNTFLDRFVPWAAATASGGGQSGVARLLSLRFNVDTVAPLADLHVQTPTELTAIGTFRYLLMAIVLLTFLFIVVKRVVERKGTSAEIVVGAFVIGQGTFAIVRALVGNLNVTYAFLPTLFAVAVLYALAPDLEMRRHDIQRPVRVLSIGVASMLLVTALLYVGIAYDKQATNPSKTAYTEADPAADWHTTHIDDGMRSDEYTANLIRIHEYNRIEPMEDVQQATTTEIKALVGRESISSERYFVLNNRLNYLVFFGWNRLAPWEGSTSERETNTHLMKIYDQDGISTYKYMAA